MFDGFVTDLSERLWNKVGCPLWNPKYILRRVQKFILSPDLQTISEVHLSLYSVRMRTLSKRTSGRSLNLGSKIHPALKLRMGGGATALLPLMCLHDKHRDSLTLSTTRKSLHKAQTVDLNQYKTLYIRHRSVVPIFFNSGPLRHYDLMKRHDGHIKYNIDIYIYIYYKRQISSSPYNRSRRPRGGVQV